MLICSECGNEKDFTSEIYGSVGFSAIKFYDNEGEFEREEDFEINYDSEKVIEESNMKCNECYCEDLFEGTESEVLKFKWEHTDKKGDWHKEQLLENERDSKVYAEAIAKKV